MDYVWQFNPQGDSKISTKTFSTWQIQDGRSINENYGTDLDKLEEGDRVGVLRTSQGDLLFFVNGVSQVSLDLLKQTEFSGVTWMEFSGLFSTGGRSIELTHNSFCRD